MAHVPASEHDHDHVHDHDHEHDPTCDVAHGKAEVPAQDKVLVAVFATPVAGFLLKYAADAGYRAVLMEPDPALAAVRDALLLTGIDFAVDEDYVEVRQLERDALERGYPQLA